MIGLYAGLMPAFTAVCVAALVLGKDFDLLGKKFNHGPWVLVFCWLAISLLIALIKRPVTAWRAGLYSSACVLFIGGVAGILSSAPHSEIFLLSLCLLAISLIATAMMIGEDKVKRPKDKPVAAFTSVVDVVPTDDISSPAKSYVESILSAATFNAKRWLYYFLFGWAALVFVESFRFAHIIAVDPHRGVGMFGVLIAILLLVPAASIVTWWPRAASVLYAVALGIFVWLYTRADLAQLIVAVVISSILVVTTWFLAKSATENIALAGSAAATAATEATEADT